MRGLTPPAPHTPPAPSSPPTTPVRVLKFGGSVLRDEHTIAEAAREVVRFRERAERVVAVVSALHGVTDRTLERARQLTEARAESVESACPHALAAAISVGEHESASWLALHLALLGHSAPVLTPAALKLTARGDPLDADPVSIDLAHLEHALDTHAVAVIPGFAAIDRHGRTVTLGRGGSDLTALFLAASLQHAGWHATCRLVKDVDGLYDRDPAHAGALRFEHACYDDCLTTDGSIVQFKGVRFAQNHPLSFELGTIGRDDPTTIGLQPVGATG
ncbi:MAG: hypothetical protein ACF8Q5_02525 [Phycisphaerales bacterium JB040]